MSNTNWTISGLDGDGNPYHYEGTHTVDEVDPNSYVWIWVILIIMVVVGSIVGGLICTGVIHCCKEANKKESGEYGAGLPPRKVREFEKYIQDRI